MDFTRFVNTLSKKNQGFREFTDDQAGGAFGLSIAKTIKQENLDNVMILFGRGSGNPLF